MKLIPVFLFACIIALSSCSSAYKTEQTPDDVYYSPGHQYVGHSNNNNDQGEYYNANPNDQYLMMKVHDPERWSTFDNYGYDSYYPYTTFGYGVGYYGGFSPWMTFGYWNPYYGFYNSYYAWNAFYNPYYYYGNVVYVGGKYSTYNTYSGLHPFNVAAYRNNTYSNTNSRYYSPNNNFNNRNGNSFNSYNNRSRSSFFNTQNNNNFNRSSSQPVRSFSPSSFGGGGGGSRGGGGGGFSRPGRP